ncbi:MAG: hypothetical protein DRN28_00520 [Thermoplasmata archaeon]|nr:MAG: hypothetical protein DRN28_00520 [Thermoplasmata archaeon]
MTIETDPLMIKIAFALCGLMALYVYLAGVLNLYGSLSAFFMGLLIILFTDVFFFMVLLIFLFLTYLVTVWKYDYKRGRGLGEGLRGERGLKNVLSNGVVATLVAVLYDPLEGLSPGLASFLFIVAVASAAADSFASEIGVLSDKVYLITEPSRRVPPGTDGGVSWLGQLSALLGALLVAIPGLLLLSSSTLDIEKHTLPFDNTVIALILLFAWVNSQIDSVLGATLQRRGILGNNGVNLVSIHITVLAAALAYTLFMHI